MTSIGDRDRRERRRRPLVAAGAIGVRSSLALGLALLAGACGLAPDATVQTVETLYQDVRAWKDELDVTRARGASRTTRGVPLTEVVARYNERLARLRDALATVRTAPPSGEDRRALDVMRRTVEETLDEDESPSPEGDQPGASVDCVYDPRRLAGDADGLKLLSDRIYACFGRAAATLSVEGTALDRLTILSLLAVTDDAERRKRLFLALDPVWQSINGAGSPASSPYRQLVRLSAAALAAGQSSVEARAA